VTREEAQQPGVESMSGETGAKVEKVERESGENGESFFMSSAGDTELLPRGLSTATQGTNLSLLVPFRNVISERRRVENKSGEIFCQNKRTAAKVEEVEKLKSGKFSGQKK
jgi:hypothetical protein